MGRYLRDFRTENNLTLEEMAKFTGLSLSLISRVENNMIAISKRTSDILFKSYGIRFVNDLENPSDMRKIYLKTIKQLESDNLKLTKELKTLKEELKELKLIINGVDKLIGGGYYLVTKKRGGKDV